MNIKKTIKFLFWHPTIFIWISLIFGISIYYNFLNYQDINELCYSHSPAEWREDEGLIVHSKYDTSSWDSHVYPSLAFYYNFHRKFDHPSYKYRCEFPGLYGYSSNEVTEILNSYKKNDTVTVYHHPKDYRIVILNNERVGEHHRYLRNFFINVFGFLIFVFLIFKSNKYFRSIYSGNHGKLYQTVFFFFTIETILFIGFLKFKNVIESGSTRQLEPIFVSIFGSTSYFGGVDSRTILHVITVLSFSLFLYIYSTLLRYKQSLNLISILVISIVPILYSILELNIHFKRTIEIPPYLTALILLLLAIFLGTLRADRIKKKQESKFGEDQS